MFHRVSFSRDGLPSSVIAQKFGELPPSGNSKPAGEYLPPSTHRHFLFLGTRFIPKNGTLLGELP
jgi:hypothetical protein